MKNHAGFMRVCTVTLLAATPSVVSATPTSGAGNTIQTGNNAVPSRTAAGRRSASPVPWNQQAMKRTDQSVQLGKKGDKGLAQGDWEQAKADYQQALTLWPGNRQAVYGLGSCADAAGDTDAAISHYRTAIYSHSPAVYGTVRGDGYQENNAGRLMEYVLLLSKAGQTDEAVSVYRRAAGLLNYEDGQQNLAVLLPSLGPSGWSYTPQRLRAMAHIAIAYGEEGFNDDQALSHLQQAVRLAPDSPLPYFYRARHWSHHRESYKDAKADYAKAAELGDAHIGTAVEKASRLLR